MTGEETEKTPKAEPGKCCKPLDGKLCMRTAVVSFVSSDSVSPDHEPGDCLHFRCVIHMLGIKNGEFPPRISKVRTTDWKFLPVPLADS